MNDREFTADVVHEAAARPHRAHETPLAIVHRNLRGRYGLALLLALALGIPGAIGGYLALKPSYASRGIVRVAPSLPKTLYDVEEGQMMRSFDSFIAAQASTIESARVIEMAVGDKKLTDAGWPTGAQGITQLTKSLEVGLKRGAELITVSVAHSDPAIAREAVNAVLHAYDDVQREKFGSRISEKERDLLQSQTNADRELEEIRGKISAISQNPGTEDRDGIYVLRLESQLELEEELATIEAKIARGEGAEKTPAPAPEVTAMDEAMERERLVQGLAEADRILAGLLSEKVALDTEIRARSKDYLPKHPVMTDLVDRRDAVVKQIDERVDKLVGTGLIIKRPGPAVADLTLEQLAARREQIIPLLGTVREEVKKMVANRSELTALNERLDRTQRRYNDISNALEALRIENKHIADGRVQIIQWGSLPSFPSSDRRIALGVAGGVGGMLLGVGALLLTGIARSNLRYIADVEHTGAATPLISAIPDLALDAPGEHDLAALSVHHLRNMLNLRVGKTRGQGSVLTISSASSGDGKTSVTLALGLSYAVGGFRTLIVDADLVGRGLSRQLNYAAAPGLTDAIVAGHLNGEVLPGPREGVSVLAAGVAPDFDAEMISPGAMERLIDSCRGNYDVILIDTGPILGSLEANLAARVSDGVVMVVSRGQHSKLVQSSLERVEQLGCRCLGLVFNKVKSADFHRSAAGQSLSIRSMSARSTPASDKPALAAASLASAVAGRKSGGTGQPE
ncbi:MAG: P-loop NTPase [Phycisphaerales bacterium]